MTTSIMSRKKLKNKRCYRIFIHKTSQHFYAQLIDKEGNIKVSYSTLNLKSVLKKAGKPVNVNFINSKFVKQAAEEFARSMKENCFDSNSYYDRGKNKYCGLVALFAETLRDNDILI